MNRLFKLQEFLQAAVCCEHFPKPGIFHPQGINLLLELKILLADIDEAEILQPDSFCNANRLMDELLNGAFCTTWLLPYHRPSGDLNKKSRASDSAVLFGKWTAQFLS